MSCSGIDLRSGRLLRRASVAGFTELNLETASRFRPRVQALGWEFYLFSASHFERRGDFEPKVVPRFHDGRDFDHAVPERNYCHGDFVFKTVHNILPEVPL